jgi:hypothetical protein
VTTYIANQTNFLGERVINAVTPQGEVPVISVTGHADILAEHLTANIADALNGVKPRHQIPYKGLRASWSREVNGRPVRGIKINLRKDERLSGDGIMVSVLGEGELAQKTLDALHEGTTAARLIRAMLRDPKPAAKPGPDYSHS